MDLIYWTPAAQPPNRERVVAAGFAYALAAGGPSVTQGPGPDGAGGHLLAFGAGNPSPVGHTLTWTPVGATGYYTGVDPADPPTPSDLARPLQRDGHVVRLGDGRDWLVPVARAVDGTTPLPRAVTWDGHDWGLGDVETAYRALFAAACRLWNGLRERAATAGEETVTVTVRDEIDLAAAALAVNYRVGPTELAVLGLLTTETAGRVCLACIDWPGVQALAKKQPAAPSPPPGDGAVCPDTPPPSPNASGPTARTT